MALWRIEIDDEARWARGPADVGPRELLDGRESLGELLGEGGQSLADLHDSTSHAAVPAGAEARVPLDTQEVWASGVTYMRSREARRLESAVPDHYDLVYEAARPELFLKAAPGRSRGPGEPVGIRADSGWDVPEPELGLVVDHGGEIVAYVIGNDMSSRRIEGENPLYLPQAKTYDGSCAIGPCLVPTSDAPELTRMEVALRVERAGDILVEESISVASMRRRPAELLDWLFRATSFPDGVVLLTGTGIVPADDFTLAAGDTVMIAITGLGELHNPVAVVGIEHLSDGAGAAR
ncbi:MAG: fumarylacetoacetate hydrolase family protein [Actinobacteria bacterium]|nr:fumarylacetoacetate hydrolase family protein [Actinomycetota bacterium]